MSELENMKLKQKQDRLQLLNTINTNQNNYQPTYQENHHHINKQYSETSIPSTNADPLSPTPPLKSHRNSQRNDNNNNKLQNNFSDNNQKTNGSNFYYKLNDDKGKF